MVTVKAYSDFGKASLDHAYLRSQDIPAELNGDSTGLQGVTFGYKLRVPKEFEAEAKRLLEELGDAELVPEEEIPWQEGAEEDMEEDWENPLPKSDYSMVSAFFKGGACAIAIVAGLMMFVVNPLGFACLFITGGVIGMVVLATSGDRNREGE